MADRPHPTHGQYRPARRRASTARAKVTGAARYASDEPVANPAYAYLVTSAIARGRISGFDLRRRRGPCRACSTSSPTRTSATQAEAAKLADGGEHRHDHDRWRPTEIWHDGQIIAVVVADTFEAAREAALPGRGRL